MCCSKWGESMIIFRAKGRAACCEVTEPITTGSVGLPVQFQFDEAWDGLSKTAVFTGSGVSVDQVIGADNALVVPWECLEDAGGTLIVGVTGTRNSGEIVIPTVLARAGVIVKGAALSGVGPHDPTPSWAVQVQEEASEALAKATAVEEAAARGDFDGQDGVSPAVTVSQITGGHSVTITDKDHPSGQSFNVMDGTDGVGVPSGGTTGQVLKKASGTDYDTEWADETGGGAVSSVNGQTGAVVLDASDVGALDADILAPQAVKNLFDPTDSDIKENYAILKNNVTTSRAGLMVSGYIPVSPGKTYVFPVYTQ